MTRENLRERGKKLDYILSPKQWINALPPISQAKLWNNHGLDSSVEPSTFKTNSKLSFLEKYHVDIRRNPELYKEYLEEKKKQEKGQVVTNIERDCSIL